MPGRTFTPTYRYNYQGQENAVNSKWQAFELRLHNSDLGRWMSPDPYGQFYSPYISMGNNPVSGVDPDGGFVNSITPGWYNAMGSQNYSNITALIYGNPKVFYEGEYQSEWLVQQRLMEERTQNWVTATTYGVDGFVAEQAKPYISHGTFGMNKYDLNQLRIATGSTYAAQEIRQIQELSAIGGWEDKNGHVWKADGQGGYWEGADVTHTLPAPLPCKDGIWRNYYTTYNPQYAHHKSNEKRLFEKSSGYITGSTNNSKPGYWETFKFAWNNRIIGQEVPDNLTLDLHLGSASGGGASMTYTVNFLTRGPDAGFHLTRTEQNRIGLEVNFGINFGANYSTNITKYNSFNSILGPVKSVSAGWEYGAGGYLGYPDNNSTNPSWWGISSGVGLTGGVSYGWGNTINGWW